MLSKILKRNDSPESGDRTKADKQPETHPARFLHGNVDHRMNRGAHYPNFRTAGTQLNEETQTLPSYASRQSPSSGKALPGNYPYHVGDQPVSPTSIPSTNSVRPQFPVQGGYNRPLDETPVAPSISHFAQPDNTAFQLAQPFPHHSEEVHSNDSSPISPNRTYDYTRSHCDVAPQDQGGPPSGSLERVPIPPARTQPASEGETGAAPSPTQSAPSGPMSTTIELPARPRPGRKPIPTEDAADRRRLQNRLAQRNFRDKRQQRVNDLRVELEAKKKDYENTISGYERKAEANKRENAKLKKENSELKKLLAEAKTENKALKEHRSGLVVHPRDSFNQNLSNGNLSLSLPTPESRTSGSLNAYGSSLTPPEDSGYEMDFTYAFPKTPQSRQARPSPSNDNMLWNPDFTRDGCGFCDSRSTYCACKESQSQHQQQQQHPPSQASDTNKRGGCSSGGMPGSCDKCQSDPTGTFARKCQELRNTVVNFRPAVQNEQQSYETSAEESMPPPPPQNGMSCYEMITQLEPMAQNKMSISELFGGQHIDARPSISGQGYSLDDQQAAQALQRLSVSFPRQANQLTVVDGNKLQS